MIEYSKFEKGSFGMIYLKMENIQKTATLGKQIKIIGGQ